MAEVKFHKLDEASSTDRLLNTIRNGDEHTNDIGATTIDTNDNVSDVQVDNSDVTDSKLSVKVAEQTGVANSVPIEDLHDSRKPSFESPRKKGFKHIKSKLVNKKATVNIGVALGWDRALLAVTVPDKNNRWTILDYKILRFTDGLKVNDPKFPKFLSKALRILTSPYKNFAIWSLIPSINVETKYIKIPKVTQDKIADAAYWTFKKEAKYDEAKQFFDYEVIGDIRDKGTEKIGIIAYAVSQKDVTDRKKLFEDAGFPLTGVTVVAFAFQNYLRAAREEKTKNNSCLLFIGKDWSRIDIYTDGFLIFSRDIKTGFMSMHEAVTEELLNNQGNSLTELQKNSNTEFQLEDNFDNANLENNNDSLEDVGLDIGDALVELEESNTQNINKIPKKEIPKKNIGGEEVEKFFQDDLYENFSSQQCEEILGLSEQQIAAVIAPVANRLAKQVERSLDFFGTTYNDYPVDKVYVSGTVCGSERLMKIFSAKIAHQIVPFDPFQQSVLESEVETPELMIIRDQFSPALCLAISNKKDRFNFLDTQKDKAKRLFILKFDRMVITAFILLMVIAGVIFGYQRGLLYSKEKKLVNMQENLSKYPKTLDRNDLSSVVAQIVEEDSHIKTYARLYAPLAIIAEITRVVPYQVYLSKLDIKSLDKGFKKLILLEGIILVEKLALEPTLAEFILNLSESPMIASVLVEKKIFDMLGGEEVDIKDSKGKKISSKKVGGEDILRFTVRLETK